MRTFFLVVLFGALACSSSPSSPDEELIARGRSVYRAQCISCHAPDPSVSGAVGPAVKNSSHELLESRLFEKSYPPGYTPQRTTHIMPAFPQLRLEIDALAAFLKSP